MIPAISGRLLLLAVVMAGLGTIVVTDSGAERNRSIGERAVAIVTLPCDTDLQSTSSGFLLDDGLVVTVAHALHGSRDHAVRDSTGSWFDAEIVHLDVARDLGILRVDGLRASPVRLGDAAAGDEVRLVEAAASGDVEGSVLRRVRMRTNVVGSDDTAARAGYELELEILPGDSGAAVVDRHGEVVAVVFSRSTRREGITWATAASEIGPVLGRADLPEWSCALDPDAALDLRPPARERLAG